MNQNGYENYPKEADVCAIVAFVKKDGIPTHGNVRRTLMALDVMKHRTGEVNFEGEGFFNTVQGVSFRLRKFPFFSYIQLCRNPTARDCTVASTAASN